MRNKAKKRHTWKKSNHIAKTRQSANASIHQGGNSISINAVDVGIVKIRRGR
ncbi:hypothetical protein [Paenibacillus sp. y28]|uniref:hypothetical protein n=1 Tax=Paenibacillus sp. y28 TaxID=3129110 RepID=UPI0030160390